MDLGAKTGIAELEARGTGALREQWMWTGTFTQATAGKNWVEGNRSTTLVSRRETLSYTVWLEEWFQQLLRDTVGLAERGDLARQREAASTTVGRGIQWQRQGHCLYGLRGRMRVSVYRESV